MPWDQTIERTWTQPSFLARRRYLHSHSQAPRRDLSLSCQRLRFAWRRDLGERRDRPENTHRRVEPFLDIPDSGLGHDELTWNNIVSHLRMVGYDGVLSIEHEDSLMSGDEGLRKATELLKRLLIGHEKPGVAYWDIKDKHFA